MSTVEGLGCEEGMANTWREVVTWKAYMSLFRTLHSPELALLPYRQKNGEKFLIRQWINTLNTAVQHHETDSD